MLSINPVCKRSAALLSGIALAATALVAAPSAQADPAVAGTFNAVAARRIVDTRTGVGLPQAQIAAHRTVTFDALTPIGASGGSAVELTITAVTPEHTGYLTAYAGGTARPGTSTVNFRGGTYATPNSAVVGLGTGGSAGRVSIYNSSAGPVGLVVDITGVWTGGAVVAGTGGALLPVTPKRILDTRLHSAAIPAGGDLSVPLAGVAPVPATGVSAVVLNATATGTSAAGYLSVTQEPEDGNARTSAVNFAAGTTRADMVVTPLATDGTISLHNGSTAPVSAVLDVLAYVSDGTPVEDGSAIVSTGYRSNDDRIGPTPVGANSSRSYPMVPGVTDGGIFNSVIATVTVVGAAQSGYVVVANGDGSLPRTSTLNHAAGQTVAQTLILPVRPDGSVVLRNVSTGTVQLVIDVTGFVLDNDAQAMLGSAATARRRADAILAAVRHTAAERLAR